MQRQTLALSLSLLFLNLWTSNLWAFESGYSHGWYFTGGLGRTSPLVEDADNYVATGPGWPNDHYVGNSTHGSAMLAVGAGYTWARDEDWCPALDLGSFLPSLSLGAQFTYTTLSKISGDIYQYSLPQFENYTYDYQFRRSTLLAVGKADIINVLNFMPYVTAGLGVSFNTTSNYSEQPLSNVTPRISPGFRSATNYYFSYMVGVGLDYVVCNNVLLSLEYNYGDFGHAHTGHGDNTYSLTGYNYSSQSLKNKLTANNYLFSVTYLLNPE